MSETSEDVPCKKCPDNPTCTKPGECQALQKWRGAHGYGELKPRKDRVSESIFEPTEPRAQKSRADSAWYLAPILFGIIGGLVGYVAVKDKDKDMATNCLLIGIFTSFIVFLIIWVLLA